MKRALLISISVVLSACSSSGPQDPNSVNFSSPSGQITGDNVTSVVNAALDSSQAQDAVGGLLLTRTDHLKLRPVKDLLHWIHKSKNIRNEIINETCAENASSCFTADENSTTVDLGCLSIAGCTDPNCTLSGTFTVTAGENDGFTTSYNNFGGTAGCGGEAFVCNGSSSVATVDGNLTSCTDLSCTVGSETENANYCTQGTYISVPGIGGNVVCLTLAPTDDSCTAINSQWRDSTGTANISCTVDATGDNCSTATPDLESVASCTIDRT